MALGDPSVAIQPTIWRTLHNRFNLVILPTILILAARDLLRWESDYYTQLFVLLYFVIDTAWIGLMGYRVVKDPQSIMVHHLAAIVLVAGSMLKESWRPFWSTGALIEVSTILLLTLRSGRVSNKHLSSMIHMAFLVSWFPLRWGVPLYIMYSCWSSFRAGEEPIFGIAAIFAAACVLLHMQVKWSAKLMTGQIRTMVSHGL
ncbi:unnamed protein product [Vitrella brassicaformis CCMP3155]|uniref:TLC domain-containing protein n=2 Tax=Vitrella brassicaformis TaxID=1169539 RepID=A0A0G4F874_VITBC|nr:unnamed protein product [Vitrella brassicaformis CCMP3155]|eukprot:CEM08915.1 unnamed protein product [Vitrella brassicaformis CCMP3155]